ncbi:MAG: DUF3868 domain-containing protein, partial [Prevotellaceae bacterium]|nr:DUF3868 domain-containing protein [Prevotellaceae bacterium]
MKPEKMNTHSKHIALTLLLSLPAGTAALHAQGSYDGRIWADHTQALHRGDSVYFDIDLLLEDIIVDSERSLTLTPMLETDTQSKTLPSVLINGYQRQKLYQRALELSGRSDAYYMVIESKRNPEQPGYYDRAVEYSVAFPYEAWMDSARIVLQQDLCSCGGHTGQLTVGTLGSGLTHFEVPAPEPEPAPVVTEVQTVEHHTNFYNYDVRLTFPTARTEIL